VRGSVPVSGASVKASAVAEAGAPASGSGAAPAIASGGGYSGPLVYRNGEGMRPDVATAFDRMAAAAGQDGLALVINSGFRSDAEQAALFAAHPDPTWVAPPGKSLHRCATELDLGPETAYGWLAANATRFGFVQRYSWEAWHYGFAAGPAPCSAAGEAIGVTGAGGGDGSLAGSGGLPAFVPPRFRTPLLRAGARWNVSPALLAAQLMAESNFNPFATSSAGAQGIAQFIPSTAAAYGLRDPFDPAEAIDAQAHLMSDLLRQFGSPSLALAAYNAGPAPVEACNCILAYPETQAYVSRILALLDGAGALFVPSFEVRLVE
jgi:Transglycosylase SLT domain/D-alanyl-D-alanine carboxypeptidase